MKAAEYREHANLYRDIALSWLMVSELDAAQRNADRARACEIAATVLEKEEAREVVPYEVNQTSASDPAADDRGTRLTHGAVAGSGAPSGGAL